MRYTFNVTTNDDENIITAEISFGSLTNTVQKTIKFKAGDDYDCPTAYELFSQMLDDVRLTVKEREEAIYNIGVLQWYLYKYGNEKYPEKSEREIIALKVDEN